MGCRYAADHVEDAQEDEERQADVAATIKVPQAEQAVGNVVAELATLKDTSRPAARSDHGVNSKLGLAQESTNGAEPSKDTVAVSPGARLGHLNWP
jgi:hypothetical protein